MERFFERISFHAAVAPEALAVRFLKDGETVFEELSYQELHSRSLSAAALMAERGLVGERVVLACPSSSDYVTAFLGCLYSGAVAVPFLPPRPRAKESLAAILTSSGARAIVVESEAAADLFLGALVKERFPQIDIILLATLRTFRSEDWCAPRNTAELAYLQYTSGSLGEPKGVMVSHDALAANVAMIHNVFRHDGSSSWVSWLPLYHDMGLVSGVLEPLYHGIATTLMPPTAFIQRPLRWLEAISRFGATTSGGPNFAFDLCANAAKASKNECSMDLSGWRIAFNGSETVSPLTLENFSRAFAGHGFEMQAFKACYGLAEATLLVTATDAARSVRVSNELDGKARASVGAPAPGVEVEIRDPETLAVLSAPGLIGEVCVGGPAVTQGYWQRPDATAEGFVERAGDRLFRTGDLGFWSEGELVICGRRKEILVVAGQNYYPQDIEACAQAASSALVTHCLAAFSLAEGPTEVAVLLLEIARRTDPADYANIVDRVRHAVLGSLELALGRVALVRQGTIPRTTSGKIKRDACRLLYCATELTILHEWRATVPREPDEVVAQPLKAIIEAAIGRPLKPADDERTLLDLGFDSLKLARASARAGLELGLDIPMSALHENVKLEMLGAALAASECEPVSDAVQQLSAGQSAMLLLQSAYPDSTRFTLVRAVSFPFAAVDDVRAAVEETLREVPAASLEITWGDGLYELADSRNSNPIELDFEDPQACRASLHSFATEPWRPDAQHAIKAILLRCPRECFLVLRAHHIICDLHGMQLLLQAVAARLAGKTPPLLQLRYGGQANHEHRDREAGRHRSALAVASRVLGGPLPYLKLLDLSDDRADASNRVSWTLPEEFVGAVPSWCQRLGVTEYVLFASLFMAALARTVDETDIIIGSPADMRRNQADFATVDNYANLIPLRLRMVAGATFAELADQLRTFLVDTESLRWLPFADLVRHLQPDRGNQASPLFQVIFAAHVASSDGSAALLLGDEGDRFEISGTTVEPRACFSRASPIGVRLDVVHAPDSVRCCLEYRLANGAEESIARLKKAMNDLALELALRPEGVVVESVPQSPILAGPSGQTPWDDLPRQILRHASAIPDSLALVDEAEAITYRELEIRSRSLAAALTRLGCPRNGMVAVQLPRGVSLVIALLAVWRLGAAYLPLDDQLPARRSLELLERVGSPFLLDADLMRRLPGGPDDLEDVAGPEVCYRIFTSGTTGAPKCVEISQSALSNLLFSLHAEIGIGEGDVVAATTSVGFDIAAVEIWLPLLLGGCVAIFPGDAVLSGSRFEKLGAKFGVTTVQGTPSTWRNLLNAGWHGNNGIRVLCGGEGLDKQLARQLLDCGCNLWNLYGPTETTVWSTAQHVTHEEASGNGLVQLGRPLANTVIKVLGADLEPVPVDCEGDLYIGGTGLANGYFMDRGLTATRFIADPAGNGCRIYETGDRAMIDKAGRLHFRGRNDRQIKISGHRLDLAEVEAFLQRIPEVNSAIAFTETRDDGRLEIWAALAKHPQAGQLSETEVRRCLRDFAPAYAIPARLQWFTRFPVNANGKASIEQLKSKMRSSAFDGRSDGGNAGSDHRLESAIADAWQEVLKVPIKDFDVTFFDYGGSSLDLVSLKSAIAKHAGVDVDLLELLRSPTVRQLATWLRDGAAATQQVAEIRGNRPRGDFARRRRESVKAAEEFRPSASNGPGVGERQ